MKTILIIDDDAHISAMLTELLQREGYHTLAAYSGTEALLVLQQQKPDLILLDLMLPGLSGEEVLAGIRGIPVIVLSAKADMGKKVQLLLEGAADYMTKPFDTRELLARITVQLRSKPAPAAAPLLTWGDLSLNTESREASVCGKPVKLTKTEFAILKLLMQHPQQVMAKQVLLERISRDTPDCTDSSLKQHISNLRKKLRDAGGHDYIEAVWGIGFKLSSKKS